MNLRRPITALFWDISRRRSGSVIALAGLMLFGLVFKLSLPARVLLNNRDIFQNISGMLMAASVVFVLAVFNFTESSPEREWTGFPYRMFVLPLPTVFLVALPLISGMAGMSLVCGFWLRVILERADAPEAGWLTLLLVSFTAFFQAVVWCLAGVRVGRLLALGLAGLGYVFVGFLPWQQIWTSDWYSKKNLTVILCGQILLLFGISWYCVSCQRCGGGRRPNWFRAALEWFLDLLPRRKADFVSASGAQFWFEWRRSGIILPLCVAGILVFFIRPLSLTFRHDGSETLHLLCWTLAAPVILAAVIGKGFSKPDFWAGELSFPAFYTVRPIASGEMVVVKMKVAALSAAISWVLVVVFLCFWLPGWADLDSLNTIRIGFWMAYGHSLRWEKLIAVLIVVAGMFSTWKCLVDGLWNGLSGRWRVFLGPPIAYGLLLFLGIVVLSVMLNHDAAVRAWFFANPDRPLSWLEDIAAAALIVKFILAARAWRDISARRVGKYLVLWLCSTGCLLALVLVLWAHGLFDLVLISLFGFLPWDTKRLVALLIFSALLVMPLARIGLARSSLEKNRHRA